MQQELAHRNLAGLRLGDERRVAIQLLQRVDSSDWIVAVIAPQRLRVGDRVRFGDQSNNVCFLGMLNAEVVSAYPDATARVRFEFHGDVLDGLLASLEES
jgi:S-adenosylmethionine:tRNA-ribosyltransferase-isomerase (queuine synthetase)